MSGLCVDSLSSIRYVYSQHHSIYFHSPYLLLGTNGVSGSFSSIYTSPETFRLVAIDHRSYLGVEGVRRASKLSHLCTNLFSERFEISTCISNEKVVSGVTGPKVVFTSRRCTKECYHYPL